MLKQRYLGGCANIMFGWLYRRKRRSHFQIHAYPPDIALEVTSACNLKCPMCPRTTMKRKPGHLPFELAEKLARELSLHHPRLGYLVLHGFGEVLLYPQLGEVLDLFRRSLPLTNLNVSVNLASARPAQIDTLIDHGISEMGVWIDSIRKETYEAQRAGGNLEKTLSAIDYVIERKRRSHSAFPLLHIGMILTRLNEGQAEEFVAFWRERLQGLAGVSIKSAWGHDFNGKIDDALLLRPRSPFYVKRPCFQPFREVYIQSSGEICFCCLDVEGETSVGNLREMTLYDAWNSEQARNFRRETRNTAFRLALCKNCEAAKFYPLDGRLKSAEYMSYEDSFLQALRTNQTP
jgi:radical SAM protein with 4Fe4S-binding SPASM domain